MEMRCGRLPRHFVPRNDRKELRHCERRAAICSGWLLAVEDCRGRFRSLAMTEYIFLP